MPPLLRVLPLAVLHLPLLVIIVKHVLLGRHEWLLHAEMLANKLGKWTDHVLNLICTRCKSKKKTYLEVSFAIVNCSTSEGSIVRFAKVF